MEGKSMEAAQGAKKYIFLVRSYDHDFPRGLMTASFAIAELHP